MPTIKHTISLTLTSAVLLVTVSTSTSAFASDAQQSQKLVTSGYAMMNSGDDAGATQTFTKAIFADPSNLNARRALAQSELRQGKSGDCVQHLEALTKLQPGVASDQVLLGQAYLSLGKTDLALTRYGRALQIEPNNAEAMLGMADVLIAKGDYVKASALCRKVIASSKKSDNLEAANNKLSVIQQLCQKPIQAQS